MPILDSRYSFTAQYLLGAKFFADQARAIEVKLSVDQNTQMEHRAYVAGTIMQATAALESEVSQIVAYGPGQHLGTNRTDLEAQKFLNPMADEIDSAPVVRRYDMILHLLRKEPMDQSTKTHQWAVLLTRLRNALVHFESKSGQEMDGQKLFKGLKILGHQKPSFVQGNVNFFPFECLSAECAEWAWKTAVAFLDEFSKKLGKRSVLEGYRAHLS